MSPCPSRRLTHTSGFRLQNGNDVKCFNESFVLSVFKRREPPLGIFLSEVIYPALKARIGAKRRDSRSNTGSQTTANRIEHLFQNSVFGIESHTKIMPSATADKWAGTRLLRRLAAQIRITLQPRLKPPQEFGRFMKCNVFAPDRFLHRPPELGHQPVR